MADFANLEELQAQVNAATKATSDDADKLIALKSAEDPQIQVKINEAAALEQENLDAVNAVKAKIEAALPQ